MCVGVEPKSLETCVSGLGHLSCGMPMSAEFELGVECTVDGTLVFGIVRTMCVGVEVSGVKAGDMSESGSLCPMAVVSASCEFDVVSDHPNAVLCAPTVSLDSFVIGSD